MLAPPEGIWGMPPEVVQKLPGYNPDVAASRAESRKIMEAAGYGPANKLKLKVTTRVYPTKAGRVSAEFVEGVLIRYTITSE